MVMQGRRDKKMGGRGTSSSGSIGGRGHQDFGGDWVAMYNQLDADLKRAKVTDISPEDVQEAIVDWSGGGYRAIRAIQRGEEHPDAWSMTAEHARILDRYIDAAPKWNGGYLYRGTSIDQLDKVQKAFSNGQTISMGGLSSWTDSREVANKFIGGTTNSGIVFVTATKSVKNGVSIDGFARRGEGEVLMSSKARFKIQRIQKTTQTVTAKKSRDIYVVTVKEV